MEHTQPALQGKSQLYSSSMHGYMVTTEKAPENMEHVAASVKGLFS